MEGTLYFMAKRMVFLLMPHTRRAPTPASRNAHFGVQARTMKMVWVFPLPWMGEGAGEGDSRVPPHLNPLPLRGEEVFLILFSN